MPSGGRPLPDPAPGVGAGIVEETGLPGFSLVGLPGEGPGLAMLRVTPERPPDEEMVAYAGSFGRRSAAVRAGFAGAAAHLAAERTDRESLLAIGEALNRFEGRYLLMPGPGTAPDDLLVVREVSPHVVGLESGDPSPFTALGVFAAIRACAPQLSGTGVVILGVGRVGSELAGLLRGAGARVCAADLDFSRVLAAGLAPLPPDRALFEKCDVLSPNARNLLLAPADAERMRCHYLVGAQDVVGSEETAAALAEEDVVVVPELVAGSGWLLNLAAETDPGGYDPDRARERVLSIEGLVREALG